MKNRTSSPNQRNIIKDINDDQDATMEKHPFEILYDRTERVLLSIAKYSFRTIAIATTIYLSNCAANYEQEMFSDFIIEKSIHRLARTDISKIASRYIKPGQRSIQAKLFLVGNGFFISEQADKNGDKYIRAEKKSRHWKSLGIVYDEIFIAVIVDQTGRVKRTTGTIETTGL